MADYFEKLKSGLTVGESAEGCWDTDDEVVQATGGLWAATEKQLATSKAVIGNNNFNVRIIRASQVDEQMTHLLYRNS